MQELTKAEQQVMEVLWKLDTAFLRDIVEAFPEPKPAYTTISTVLRVLVRKEFVGYKTYGKVHQYHPLIAKQTYFSRHFKNIANQFFKGSGSALFSHFAENEKLSLQELEEIRNIIEEQINQKKADGNS
ncbi:BlaI/MecI/CopY family transcriptional regulator [bacterium]|nr:BlaI/MecI/CopY family transcriptional regulator [bacterium]